MSKNFINPYQTPYLQNTNNDIQKMYQDIQNMYNQMQNPQPQPIIISQSQQEFFKSKKYSDKMQDYFMGFLISRYGNEFRISPNYKEFENWANEEFKVFDAEYNNKLKRMEAMNK